MVKSAANTSEKKPLGRGRGRGKHPSSASTSSSALPPNSSFDITIKSETDAPETVIPFPLSMVCNDAYLKLVLSDAYVIKNKWPDIASKDPLPLTDESGYLRLTGFLEPFNKEACAKMSVAASIWTYLCGINFFWQDIVATLLPHVPLYFNRLEEYALDQYAHPSQVRHSLSACADFVKGAELPRGSLVWLSPCEGPHALIHRVACRIRAGAPESEHGSYPYEAAQ